MGGVMENRKENLSRISLIDKQNVVQDMKAKSLSFFCKNNPVLINDLIINELKEISRLNNNANCRVCLHSSPDALQHDMIILERKDAYFRPHKHNNAGETFHIIEGEMGVFSFDEKGNVYDSIILQKADLYRIAPGSYHAVFPITDYVIYHENKAKPLEGGNDSIFADWSPEQDDLDGIKAYKKNHQEILNVSKFIRKDTICRICNCEDIETVLKLNDTPLEDQFVDETRKHIEQKVFPLELALCNNCGYVHLPHLINPDESYVDFLYKSGNTPGLRSHFDDYAEKIVKQYNIKKNSLIVDLGSNDGSMLASFKRHQMNVIGVEPAKLIAEYANQSGVETINDYFTNEVVSKIISSYGKADVISANYMFANIDNIVHFTQSVESLLSEDGLFVVETGYHLEQFKIKMFDYIYHEHFSYFTVGVLSYLFNRCGMEIIDAQKTRPKGGSIRVVAQKQNGSRKISPSVEKFIKIEDASNIYKKETYKFFDNSLIKLKLELINLLEGIQAKGKSIIAFGASHSTTTLIYHFELGNYFNCIVDDNEVKHGHYSPGLHIPVFSTDKMYIDKPDYVLILAWQHKDVICDRHSKFIENGGKFITPLPQVSVMG